MKTKLCKEQFTDKINEVVKNRKALKKFFDTTFKKLLKEYDGKQLNKRFKDALNAELKKVSPKMFISFDKARKCSCSNYPNNYLVFVMLDYNDEYFIPLRINIVLDYCGTDSLRICADLSLTEKYSISWYDDFNADTMILKDAVKNYDKYIKVTEKMEAAIRDFNDINLCFRNNIVKAWLPDILC
jgi:hypothetical protein